MKNFLLLIIFTFNFLSFAQQAPKVILKDSSQLKLTSLKVEVNIVGNFATTTYDMKFYNELDRTLEGELAFPLGQGQSVSNFVMDVNGKLRDAVIVEKELARVAYENTIRQKIDPGLLEKTEGNNYKARVYPILPKKYKQIVITYEQELRTVNDFMLYELPLNITTKLDDFSIDFNVAVGNKMPVFKSNPYKNLSFKMHTERFHATVSKNNHVPKDAIVLKIPNNTSEEKVLTYNEYFYGYKSLQPKERLKSKSKKITLLWDTSFSLKNRNVAEELKLLGSYFEYLQNVDVTFVSFSNAIVEHKKIIVKNGEWNQLKQLINQTVYDGGTNFNCLKNLKFKTDETLLFTDGLDNLGAFPSNNKKAVYVVNSLVSANHESLNNMATKTGGSYINLNRLDTIEALQQLKNETFQFLGISKNEKVSEVYPNKNTNVTTDFSIAGQFFENTTIQLLFGYSGKVTQKENITIRSAQQNSLVKRLWAKQKLRDLNFNKKENKSDIITLATQNHLITDYTSMLILDRLEDYVRYRIEPPKELKRAYKTRIANIESDNARRKRILDDRKEDLKDDYEDILTWYNTKYPKRVKKISKKESTQVSEPIVNTSIVVSPDETMPSPEIETIESTPNSNSRNVSGIVVDESNMPLPGAAVVIKGTATGASTDFDGKYSITTNEGDVLTFSYVGYSDQEMTVGSSNSINVNMVPDNELTAVVVTALGIKRNADEITSSYDVVKTEELTQAAAPSVIKALTGKVSGLQITNTSNGVAGGNRIVLRGGRSISGNNQALIVIDGVISNSGLLQSLDPNQIESVNVLKGPNGAALYGSQGINGVVIVITKDGKVINEKEIAALNDKIENKIELKVWNPNTPYLRVLETEKTVEAAYTKYLEIRENYTNVPTFYLDVADFFDKKNSSKTAIKVLTNLIEVDLNNYELTKALGYKLEYFKEYELAVKVYEKVLEIRPEEPQSYRDLALAYEAMGAYQKSFDLLYKIYSGDLLEKDTAELFKGIETIAFVELSRLINVHGKKIQLNKKQKELFKSLLVDVRVVIDWNHKETDIDLWVIDPTGEKCLYSNSETKIGGRISEDFTDGYGPEEFMVKKAVKGRYKILVDYYGDTVQKISGPTILKVTMFTNYGKPNEVKKTITVRLDKEEDDLEIGSFIF